MTAAIVRNRSYIRAPARLGLHPAGSTPNWALAGWKVMAMRLRGGSGSVSILDILSYALGLSRSEVRRRLRRGQFLWSAGGDKVELGEATIADGAVIILDPYKASVYCAVEICDWRSCDGRGR